MRKRMKFPQKKPVTLTEQQLKNLDSWAEGADKLMPKLAIAVSEAVGNADVQTTALALMVLLHKFYLPPAGTTKEECFKAMWLVAQAAAEEDERANSH